LNTSPNRFFRYLSGFLSAYRVRLSRFCPAVQLTNGGNRVRASTPENVQSKLEKRGKIGALSCMIEVTTTHAVNQFHQLLNKVERGETVRIRKHGRASARIVPDCDFMSGKDFANVFVGYKATAQDKAAAAAIAANIAELDAETDHALAH